MSIFKMIIGFLVLSMPILLNGNSINLNQKNGLWQSQETKQIQFKSYSRVEIDFEKMPLKYVTRIQLHDNKIFILDNKRSELYVADKSGKHLYTIGRPGQGPGDIEYGCDFCIANDRIYVLNNMSRRISVFKINGEPVEIIKLDDIGGLNFPTAIGLDLNKNIIIGGAFDPVLSIYSPKGKFQKNLLQKKDMVAYKKTPPLIGIPSSIKIVGDSIYHFDIFKGVITKMNSSGKIDAVFSPYRDYIDKWIKEIMEESKNDTGRSIFNKWSHFYFDVSGNIYILCTLKEKGVCQDIFVFSKDGKLLYSIPLDFFMDERIRFFTASNDEFVFLTIDYEMFLAK
jgi:6-bladed beta-propeller